jgi:hypothetical protein
MSLMNGLLQCRNCERWYRHVDYCWICSAPSEGHWQMLVDPRKGLVRRWDDVKGAYVFAEPTARSPDSA